MPKKYLIGTRGSLLARTQCEQIQRQLIELTGDDFELKIIKTHGDEQTDKALWQLDGKDFFTRELDHALLAGEVDLVVHSYKDLGSLRPEGIELAAITKRSFANDILLIRQEIVEQLSSMETLIVGTSSPRRIINVEKNLSRYIPSGKNGPLKIQTEILRGNINTRIEKLKSGQYHAIILAFAGLERLAIDPQASLVLKELLSNLNFMILPMHTFPWAASQGALAVECASTHPEYQELKEKLGRLNHHETIAEVKSEREAFQSYGGGCHLAVGVASQMIEGVGILNSHRGIHDEKEIQLYQLQRSQALSPIKLSLDQKVFIGKNLTSQEMQKWPFVVGDELTQKKAIANQYNIDEGKHYFFAHPLATRSLKYKKVSQTHFWAAGGKTHEQAVKQGFWINGESESLGEVTLGKWLNSKTLKLLGASLEKPWISLTHAMSASPLGTVKEGFIRDPQNIAIDHKNIHAYYWMSYSQYCDYREQMNPKAQHFCGLGKSWQQFKNANIEVTPLFSEQEFLALITQE